MAKIKKDFSALLDKAKETEVKTPVQKVVPVKINTSDPETYKLNLRIYMKDYEDLLTFINYMIVDKKNLNYKMSDAITEGIHLLTEQKDIKRGMPVVKLAVGRKDQTSELDIIKSTTAVISIEDKDLLNDFIYHKKIAERNTKYSRVDLMADLMDAIRKNNKNIF